MTELPILSIWGDEGRLEEELELKVRASGLQMALFKLEMYLTGQYGPLFNLQVLEPFKMVSPGVWAVKLRAGRAVGLGNP